MTTIQQLRQDIIDINDSEDLTSEEKNQVVSILEQQIKDLEKATPKNETKTVSINKEPKKASQAEQTKLLKKHLLEKFKDVSDLSIKTENFSGGNSYLIRYEAVEENEKLEDYLSNNLSKKGKGIVFEEILIEPKMFVEVVFDKQKKETKNDLKEIYEVTFEEYKKLFLEGKIKVSSPTDYAYLDQKKYTELVNRYIESGSNSNFIYQLQTQFYFVDNRKSHFNIVFRAKYKGKKIPQKVLDYYSDLFQNHKKESSSKIETVKPNRRLAQEQTRSLPMVIRTQEHPKDKEVKANDLESEFAVKYVKSFLLMIGKKKLRKNLQSLLNAINKSADKKEIRAKSIHSEAINYVAQSLVAALNTDYATFVFKLDKIGSEILEPYMNVKEALPNRLLRSFYTSQNKKFAKTHENLLKRLEKIENKDNPFAIEISEAIKVLKKAQQNKSTIQATKPTLRGLEGIGKRKIKSHQKSKKKASLNGFDFKKVTAKGVIAGAASGAIGGTIGTFLQQSLSGVELLEVDYETMDLSFDFSKIGLDDMPKNASILVYGKPKHGKSTFALQLANELSKKGSLLYVANEEMMSDGKPSKSLQDRVKRIGYTPTMRFSKNLNVQLSDFQFIVIDSINALGLDIEAWRKLRNDYPNAFFVLVSQVTKSGVFRGSQEWAHDVDVIVDVKNGKADIMGRFGSGEYEIFEKEENEYKRNENYVTL